MEVDGNQKSVLFPTLFKMYFCAEESHAGLERHEGE